ncbi:MAG: hypothetical protein HOK41_05085 [Nitrospina sp.]|jgi:hypothetical protein|nr:hypothetical protein [Nitrospina sp.]
MAISTSVRANITVGFDDQFTSLSQQAFEEFKQNAKTTFQQISESSLKTFNEINKGLKELSQNPILNGEVSIFDKINEVVFDALALFGTLGVNMDRVRSNLNAIGDNVRIIAEKFGKFISEDSQKSLKFLIESFKNLRTALAQFPNKTFEALKSGIRTISTFIRPVVSGIRAIGPAAIALVPALAVLGPQLLIAAAAIGTFALAWEAGKLLGEYKVGDKTINQYVFDAFDFWLSGDLLAKLENSFDGFLLFMSNSASNLANTFINGINNLPLMVRRTSAGCFFLINARV